MKSPVLALAPTTSVPSAEPTPSVPTTNTSVALALVPTNTHSMTIRSENGMYKPKALTAIQAFTAKIDYTELEPPNFKIAVRYP